MKGIAVVLAGIGRVWMVLAITLSLLLGCASGVHALPTQTMDHADHHTSHEQRQHHAAPAASPCCSSVEAPDRLIVSRVAFTTRLAWPLPSDDDAVARDLTPESPPPKTVL